MLKRKLPLVLILTLLISLIFVSCSDDNNSANGQDGDISLSNYYFTCSKDYVDLYNDFQTKYALEKREIVFLSSGLKFNEVTSGLTGNNFEFADINGNVMPNDSSVCTGLLFGQYSNYRSVIGVVLCDVNGDGAVTEDDAVLTEKIAANEATADSVYNIIAADVDTSLTIDENDAALIRAAIGSEKKLSELYDKAERIIKKNYPNLCHARPFDFSRVPEYSSVE